MKKKINGIEIDDDDQLEREVVKSAVKCRQKYLEHINEYGRPTLEEANEYVMNCISETGLSEEDNENRNRKLCRYLNEIYCQEIGIDPAQVALNFVEKEKNSFLLERSLASAVDLQKTIDEDLLAMITFDKEALKGISVAGVIKIFSHEFGHVRQYYFNKALDTYYNSNMKERNFRVAWLASSSEKDADNFAYAKTIGFLVKTAKERKLTKGYLSKAGQVVSSFVNKKFNHLTGTIIYTAEQVVGSFVKSKIKHLAGTILYPAVKLKNKMFAKLKTQKSQEK